MGNAAGAGGRDAPQCLSPAVRNAVSRNLNVLSETRKSQRCQALPLPHAIYNSYSQELGMHRALCPPRSGALPPPPLQKIKSN